MNDEDMRAAAERLRAELDAMAVVADVERTALHERHQRESEAFKIEMAQAWAQGDDAVKALLEKLERERSERKAARRPFELADARVRRQWTEIRRGLNRAESALERLAAEQKAWTGDDGLFPMDIDAVNRMGLLLNRFDKFSKRIGLRGAL